MKHAHTLGLSLLTVTALAQTARVQVIHNCADAAAVTVDVYLDNTLLIDDFAFRTATPFIDAPAGVPFTVGIAPASSTSSAEAIYTQDFTLADGGTYVVVASGIVSGSGYDPAPAFNLVAFGQGQEVATLPTNTDVLVFHGSTDAPTVDVFESAELNVTAVDNASYGDFAGYLNLPTNDYVLQVRDGANTTIVATYGAPLATLGLDGAALTVVASGFLNPAANSNGPAFGLFAALASGGALVPLPLLSNPSARVQVIHNCADLAAATVDVYLNNTLLLDDFAFRTATPFVDAPATIPFTVGIAPANSTSSAEAIYTQDFTLSDGETYVVVANGIVSGSGYDPAPPFNLYATGGARETATSGAGNTDILVFHGCTDAPTVDVAETEVVNATLVDDLSYGEFEPYLEVPTNDYELEVQTSTGTPLVSYQAPLASLGLAGQAISVLASGFLDPTQNSDGAAFGLWVALSSGGALVELPLATAIQEEISNIDGLEAWPNPAEGSTSIRFEVNNATRASIRLSDLTGRSVINLGQKDFLKGPNTVSLSTAGLPAGAYVISISDGTSFRVLPLQVIR